MPISVEKKQLIVTMTDVISTKDIKKDIND